MKTCSICKYIFYSLHDVTRAFEIMFSVICDTQSAYRTMNEVSGGKQDIPNTSSWETLSVQSVPTMHHHHQTLQQDASPTVAPVIVPTPVKLQTPMLTPAQTVADHCPQLSHIQQPPSMTQVRSSKILHSKTYITLYNRITSRRLHRREVSQSSNCRSSFSSKAGKNSGAREKIGRTFGIN